MAAEAEAAREARAKVRYFSEKKILTGSNFPELFMTHNFKQNQIFNQLNCKFEDSIV